MAAVSVLCWEPCWIVLPWSPRRKPAVAPQLALLRLPCGAPLTCRRQKPLRNVDLVDVAGHVFGNAFGIAHFCIRVRGFCQFFGL